MKRVSFIIIFIITVLNINNASAQVYRFKADSFSVLEKNKQGKWMEWTEAEPSTVVITLDGNKDRLVINSKEIQLYNILAYGEKLETEKDETIPLKCTDNDGGLVTVLIVTRKNQDDRKQFYINYKDIKIVYNVYPF